MFVMSYIVLYMNSKRSKFNHWKRIYYFFEIPEYQNLEWHGQKRLSSKLQKWKLQSNSKRKRSLVRINILIWFALAKNCTVYSKCGCIFFILKWYMYINSVKKKIKQALSMYMYLLLSSSSQSNTCIDLDHCDGTCDTEKKNTIIASSVSRCAIETPLSFCILFHDEGIEFLPIVQNGFMQKCDACVQSVSNI